MFTTVFLEPCLLHTVGVQYRHNADVNARPGRAASTRIGELSVLGKVLPTFQKMSDFSEEKNAECVWA